MIPHPGDLFIEGGGGDFACFNVFHQPAIRANKADVQFLFRLVPLAADHDPVPVAVGAGTGDDRADQIPGDAGEPLKQIRNLLVLEPQLRRVINVLILAASARAEVTALRLNPFGGGGADAHQTGPAEILLQFKQLHLGLLTGDHEGNKDHEVVQPGHPLTAEGQVLNFDDVLLSYRQRGRISLDHVPPSLAGPVGEQSENPRLLTASSRSLHADPEPANAATWKQTLNPPR